MEQEERDRDRSSISRYVSRRIDIVEKRRRI